MSFLFLFYSSLFYFIFFFTGGPDHVVQIDESVVTRKKYNRGRLIREKWVLGIYDTALRRGTVIYVEDRKKDTLERLILAHVLPGTEIRTDCSRGYSGLNSIGGASPYIHKTVNHTRNFIDPVTGVCTNHV